MSKYLFEVVLIILFIVLAYQCVVKKNALGERGREKYTEESVAKFSALYLIGLIIAIVYEILLILCQAKIINIGVNLDAPGAIPYLLKIAGVLPLLVFTLIGYAAILKKK